MILSVLLSLPFVQTYLAKRTTNYLNETYKTNIKIDKADFSYLGNVTLKTVRIDDHHNDSLIYVDKLSTSIFSYRNILNNKLELGAVDLEDVFFQVKTHKGEEKDGLSVFVDSFDDGKKSSSSPFELTSSLINVTNAKVKVVDENDEDGKAVVFNDIFGSVSNFKVVGPDIDGHIENVKFIESHNIPVENLTADFSFRQEQMRFDNLSLQTKSSNVEGTLAFNYKNGKLTDFNNKVLIDATVDKSKISFQDLNKFYDGFSTQGNLFVSTKVNGTLNDFTTKNVKLTSTKNASVYGDIRFQNVFNKKEEFKMNADFDKLSANYKSLQLILPNTLGKTVPVIFDRLGQFNIRGPMSLTSEEIKSTFNITTEHGLVESDLTLTNIDDIDNASYVGTINLLDFNLGKIVNDEELGVVSMNGNVDGSGFDLERLNTSLKGDVSKLNYKGYEYTNVAINGQLKNKFFTGKVVANDPNVKLDFDGKADLSKEIYDLDFKANIGYANLNKLNLLTIHDKAIIKGKIDIDATGNNLENFAGNINVKNGIYTNNVKAYKFKEFNINSSFNGAVRTLTMDSPDIANGKIVGTYNFDELEFLVRNSLGSMYDNFRPHPVSPNQKLNFNLKLQSKIVELFLPDVKLTGKTTIKGQIDADKDLFKVTVKAPEVFVYNNIIKAIRMQVDSKNPLFNTQLSVGEINAKYDINKLNLVTVNLKDTLFIRTEFLGGKNNTENYNLSLYHTINAERKSVIGFKKSDFTVNNTKWFVNKNNHEASKIIVSNNLKNFQILPLSISSENQGLTLNGDVKLPNIIDLNANFDKVQIASLLPEIKDLKIAGILDGEAHYKQNGKRIEPSAGISIEQLIINDELQGNLTANLQGKNLRNYDLNIELKSKIGKTFTADGNIDFSKKTPTIDVNTHFEEYSLIAFGKFLGKDVLTNIRGNLYGDVHVNGKLEDPSLDGGFFLDSAGFKIPYLNVDYDFEGTSVVNLNDHTFEIEDLTLNDIVYDTRASVLGTIKHAKYSDWRLDLDINTPNLLVLNTAKEDNDLYFGKGFLKGDATISGLTDKLAINVTGSTNPGTHFVIPLSDVNTASKSGLLHFKTPEGDEVVQVSEEILFEKFKGLNLNFNLNVTNDALMEMVIDQSTGSDLKGRGHGNLLIDINTRGKFNMYGDITIDQGEYNFKYQALNFIKVDKKFEALPGGTISWSGNPMDAELNIEALYKLKANPRALLESYAGTRKIPVELKTTITGGLFNSKMDFDIAVPNSSSDIASELDFKLRNNEGSMTRNFIALLVTGGFYNETNLNSNVNSALAGTTSDIISSAISDIFNTNSDKFNIDIGYQVSDRGEFDQIDINDQIDVSVSTQLNDRILINGNVGVPVGAKEQSTVVGDVEVEFLLNEQGSFRAKAFNRQNEIQYTDEEEGYTQGVGLSYSVDFDNGKELLEKLGLKKKKVDTLDVKMRQDTIKKRQLLNFE